MKKTLVALAVTTFAASASALTIYDNDGSKVDFDGSIRLLLEQKSTKGDKTTKRAHSNLHNDGSRFGVKMTHNLSEDLFAFGRLEFRFNGNATNVNKKVNPNNNKKVEEVVEADNTADSFGSLYAHRAYVGFGSKKYGELMFGRQETIGDDIAQSGFDKAYGAWDTTLTKVGKSVIRYNYKGIEGLQVSVDYRFAEKRDSYGEVESGELKSGYGAGVVYGFNVADGQSVKVAAGYTRDNYKSDSNKSAHKDAYAAGVSYRIDALTLAADYAGAFMKKSNGNKDRLNGFRVGVKYAVTPTIDVYGNYGHAVNKATAGNVVTKTNINKFMLGTSYQLHKNVLTYVEGGYAVSKVKGSSTKETDKSVGVGLRVFW